MINWKMVAIVLSGAASAISLASTFVDDNRRREQIREEIEEAFAEREQQTMEEEA